MKLFISAGGTGGHIFPGIAVAEAFAAKGPGNEPVFIGTPYGLEEQHNPPVRIQAPPHKGETVPSASPPIKKVATLIGVLEGHIALPLS